MSEPDSRSASRGSAAFARLAAIGANLLGRIHLLGFLLAYFAATFWITDASVNPHPPLQSTATTAAHRVKPRMLIVVIDSLRHQTATNPDLMPHLCALATEGASAKVDSAFTPITAASMRDIFTGRANSAVLAWVINFAKVGGAVESLFSQLTHEGITSAVYSRWLIFDQFGAVITYPRAIPTDSKPAEETAQAAQALHCFLSGEADVVLAHIDTTDKVGHQFGAINTPEYAETFRRADAFIGEARRQLPAGATLVVLGDHGHNEQGRHTVGMEVPTYTVYFGPVFQRGVHLGTLKLPTHRWLMSQALGLSVDPEHYDGAIVPQALRPDPSKIGSAVRALTGAAPHSKEAPWLVWVYLSVLSGLFVALAARGRTALDLRTWRSLLPWLALLPLVLLPSHQIEVGLAAALAVFAIWSARLPVHRWLAWPAVAAAAGLAFHCWGRLLFVLRPFAERVTPGQTAAVWAGIAVIGAALCTPARRPWLNLILLGGVTCLGFPTNERIGFPTMLAPLIGCWVLFYLVALVRAGALTREDGRVDRRAAGKLTLLVAGIFLCLQPFASVETFTGDFIRWIPLVPPLSAQTGWYIFGVAFAAMLLLLAPHWPGWTRATLAVVLSAAVVTLEWGGWRFATSTWLTLLGTGIVAWPAAWRWRRPEARLLGLAWLFLAYRYFVWPEYRQLMLATTVMIGALALCARLRRTFPPAGPDRSDGLVLGVFGLLVTGWAICLWSARYLDWDFAIAWVGISKVELHAWLFGPLIAFKNALPWLACAWVLRDELRAAAPLPLNTLWIVLVARFCASLMVNTGLATADLTGGEYYLSAQLSTVMGLLLFCLIVMPSVWPGQSPDGLPSGSERPSQKFWSLGERRGFFPVYRQR